MLACAQAVVRIVAHRQRQQLVAKAVGRTKLRAAANVSTTTTTGRSTIPDGYDYVEPTLAQRAHLVLTKSRTNHKELWIYLPTDPVVELLQCYLVELLLRQLGALDIMSTCIRRFCARSSSISHKVVSESSPSRLSPNDQLPRDYVHYLAIMQVRLS